MTGVQILRDDLAQSLRPLRPAERAILDAIRRSPGISRAAIASALGLSPALLTKTIAAFLDEGWISEERAKNPTGRGQPALRLQLRGGAIAGLGLSVSTGGIAAASVGIDGTVLGADRVAFPGAGSVAGAAQTLVAGQLRRAPTCAGIVLSLPALIAPSGEVQEITPSQRGIDFEALRRSLQEASGIPVWFENKATGIDEAMARSDRDAVIFVLLMDYGIGGALIEGGRVFRGTSGHAVNIGSLIPESGPRPALPDLARALSLEPQALDFDRLTALAAEFGPELRAWVAARGRALSGPLATVVQLFNPSDIVLAGLFPRSILAALIPYIDLDLLDHPGRMPLPKPQISVARHVGPDAAAIAAANAALYAAIGAPPDKGALP